MLGEGEEEVVACGVGRKRIWVKKKGVEVI